MALTVDKLINDDRFCGENVLQFILYLPFGIILLVFRVILALVLWIASIILPNNQAVRHLLSSLACWTFGVYVKLKGSKDPRCSVMVSNCVSCLDSLAVSHVLGTISLKKWKVPPFFASTLGIRNAAQFVRKQHFTDCPSKPVLLQPEGGPTNGKGLLKFTDWPFQIGNRVQPVAITVERPFTRVTVHAGGSLRGAFPWADALWFLWTPVTVFRVRLLPALERRDDADAALAARLQRTIATALGVEATELKWEDLNAGTLVRRRRSPPPELARLARQVKEVLPAVPVRDILRDLAITRSVDVTITNFLEGVTPYTAEASPGPSGASGSVSDASGAGASGSVSDASGSASGSASGAAPRYVTPAPTGVFPSNAKERQLSFQERKAQMIAEARQRYIEKHGLNIALNC